MIKTHGNSNAQILFGVRRIPTDNHIRDLLDAVVPQQIFPMSERIFAALHERGRPQALRMLDGQLLIAFDGAPPASPIEQQLLQALCRHKAQ